MSSPIKKKQKVDNDNNESSKKPERLQCHFVLVHKGGRRCKMTRPAWSNYCSQHQDAAASIDTTDKDQKTQSSSEITFKDKRVPCPLDPNHTVRETQLQRHLKKCPKAKSQIPPADPWFNLDMNILNKSDEKNQKQQSFEPTPEYYKQMEIALEAVWQKVLQNEEPELEVLSHPGLQSRL